MYQWEFIYSLFYMHFALSEIHIFSINYFDSYSQFKKKIYKIKKIYILLNSKSQVNVHNEYERIMNRIFLTHSLSLSRSFFYDYYYYYAYILEIFSFFSIFNTI